MRREEVLLTEAIERTLDEVHTAHVKFHEAEERQTLLSIDDPEDHEYDDAKEVLEYLIDKVYRDTALLAERLGVPQFASQIYTERAAAGKNLAEATHTHHDVLSHLPNLARVWSHFQSLRAMTDVAATTVQDVLATMLRNTGKLISQKGLKPSSETQVRNAMLESLKLAFEDARKEVPIAKGFKTYKADIAVPSLRTAIEYKYVKSAEEMRGCLDGIYADMKGYGGDDAWRTFYAVFYMTGPYFRQDEVEKEFALVRADLNWTPIVVSGPSSKK